MFFLHLWIRPKKDYILSSSPWSNNCNFFSVFRFSLPELWSLFKGKATATWLQLTYLLLDTFPVQVSLPSNVVHCHSWKCLMFLSVKQGLCISVFSFSNNDSSNRSSQTHCIMWLLQVYCLFFPEWSIAPLFNEDIIKISEKVF